MLAGENSNLYEEFIDVFDKALNDIGVGIDNRICVPGNHDVSRKDVIENNVEHNGVISQLTTEKKFNDYTAKSNNVFQKKFTNYGVFEKKFSKMGVVNDLYCGTGHALNESIGVYCLNTAISSCAESGDDKDVLMINTRKLVEWSRQNNLPCKILIMHHPIEWLEDWSKKELRTILESDFSLCLSGHTHDQTIYHSSDNGSLMTCCAPALFTNKNDDLGYSIIDINDNGKIENVTYRQWTKRRNFTKGVNFTDGEDGVVHIKKSADTAPKDAVENSENKSVINRIFSQRLDEALKSFSSQPRVWVEPTLMSCAEDVKCDEDIEPEDLTELTLNPRSIIIQAPPQFGQTCLAYYLVKKAWMKNRLWMYLNAKKLKIHTIDKAIKSELELLDLNVSDIQCIVLDSWVAQDSSAIKILKKIVEKYTDIPVVIMQSIDDIQVMNEVIALDFDRKLDTLYIWSLSRDKIRTLVTGYNDERHIGEDESVICKVISDTQALNMHRTPLNCLTLLKVSEIGFDDSPVNRTEVIKRVLFLLFNVDNIPTYKSRPDLKDCEYVLGRFCEKLIREKRIVFSRKDFIETLKYFCRERVIGLDVQVVFDVLHMNNIVVMYGDEFAFRFSYWIHYFSAQRMHQDKNFSDYVLQDRNYSLFPEIIEFYTGIDRSRNDALEILINDIKETCDYVEQKCGLPDEMNPFKFAKWNATDESIEKMQEEISDSVLKSKLPNSVKDKYSDTTYDRSLPYNQGISDIFKDYSLVTLMQIVKAGARALRNSDYADPDLKRELLHQISRSWNQMSNVLIVLAPILAQKKTATYDGAGFMLFGEYSDTPEERLNEILSALPTNVVDWYKDDLYSTKMAPLLFDHLATIKDELALHRFMLLLISERPNGWRAYIEKYIEKSPKNSFYLFDVYSTLRSEYRYSFSTNAELKEIEYVLKMSAVKHKTGSKKPSRKLIGKVSDDALPDRTE